MLRAINKYPVLISALLVKPSMPETTALGAAMAAGAAEGVGVWSLNLDDLTAVTCECFEPKINPEGKEETKFDISFIRCTLTHVPCQFISPARTTAIGCICPVGPAQFVWDMSYSKCSSFPHLF